MAYAENPDLCSCAKNSNMIFLKRRGLHKRRGLYSLYSIYSCPSSSTTTQQTVWLVRGRGARRRHRSAGEEQPRCLLERAERGVRRLHHARGAQECGGEARRHLLTGDSGTHCSHAVHMPFYCHMHMNMIMLCTCCAHAARAYWCTWRCTCLLAGDGEVRYGGIRAVRGGRVRIVRQGVEVQVGQPVHVYRMHVHCTRAAYPPHGGQGRCRCTASTHAAGWRARRGASDSRPVRAARSARG